MKKRKIEYRWFLSDWKEVDAAYARKFFKEKLSQIVAMNETDAIAFIESKYLRGITIKELFNGDE